MKITLIAPLPPLKYISWYSEDLATALGRIVDLEIVGFKTVIPYNLYVGGALQKIKNNKTTKKNYKVSNLLSFHNPISWIKAAFKINTDIVHAQHWAYYAHYAYFFIFPILKLRRKKIVLTIHNITPHVPEKFVVFLDRMMNKILFLFPDIFIVHNQRNKQLFMKIYHTDNDNTIIIPVGVVPPENTTIYSKKEARDRLKLPQNKKILLFFGYIWRYKGIDTLIKSFNLIYKEIPDVLLVIAGQPLKKRDSWDKYECMINECNLQKYIIKNLQFIPKSMVPLYFSAADLLILPYKEPFDTHGGIGPLALSFKKPMVVTDIGGLPEFVKDKCAISPPDDFELLARNTIRILKDEKLLLKLEHDSAERAKELTWDSIAEKTVDIYKNLLKKEFHQSKANEVSGDWW